MDKLLVFILLCGCQKISSHEGTDYDGIIYAPSSSISCDGNNASYSLSGTPCPPWSTCDAEQHSCVCHNSGGILCGATETLVAVCHCLTYSQDSEEFLLGPCFYNCGSFGTSIPGSYYYSISNNLSSINSAMCGRLKRTGPLRAECLPGHKPLVYSYYMHCVKCSDSNRNWWKFLMAAFLPLTAFYFAVFFFKVSITPPYIYCFILYSQCVTAPAFLRTIYITKDLADNKLLFNLVKLFSCFYNIWSLDFFRGYYNGFCLGLDTLHTLAIEYTIAFYPILLMLLTHVLRKIDRKTHFSSLVYTTVLVVKGNGIVSDSTRSLVDAYAVFFVLSLTKILFVSFDLLIFVSVDVLNTAGKVEKKVVLYFDGSKPYFGKSHLPFAILAIFVSTTFVVSPLLLLLLYPCKFFQKWVNRLPLGVSISLRYFVDKFQGYYKDGLENTKDYRYLSVTHIVLLIVLCVVYACTLNRSYYIMASFVLMLAGVIYVLIQPFKTAFSHYSKITAAFFVLLGLQYSLLAASLSFELNNVNIKKVSFGVIFSLALIPAFYVGFIFLYHVSLNFHCGRKYTTRFKIWFVRNSERTPIYQPLSANN